MVAYNAESTLASVLDRIPDSFRKQVAEVVVCDDASTDNTYEVGLRYQRFGDLPLTVIRRKRNLGYGGNQKAAYLWAIDRGLDVVVLLHGDGQYAPEVLEEVLAPFGSADVDAVFGSRMMVRGDARRGGMPLYKYLGNRILSRAANAVTGMSLSEWHSGYRAYRVSALTEIPFERNSDGFDFDTEIILQLHEAHRRIVEVPIPTYYGDEICYVNGVGYAADVMQDLARYRLHKAGFGSGDMAFNSASYELKHEPSSSHQQLLAWIGAAGPQRVLDLGCGDGRIGELLRRAGHYVVGVDAVAHDGVDRRVDRFVRADLNAGIPAEVGHGFDAVLAADVIEHLVDPQSVLESTLRLLAPGGRILVSVPNFGHWYARLRVASGRFDYERRGIFDQGHLRFFTMRSFERMVRRAGAVVTRRSFTGLPVEVLGRGGPPPRLLLGAVSTADGLGLAAAPGLFGYQLLFELAAADHLEGDLPAADPAPLTLEPISA